MTVVNLQAWYAAHPPARGYWWSGTRPYVHRGFLKSWVCFPVFAKTNHVA
jgi:hypothetical protein